MSLLHTYIFSVVAQDICLKIASPFFFKLNLNALLKPAT